MTSCHVRTEIGSQEVVEILQYYTCIVLNRASLGKTIMIIDISRSCLNPGAVSHSCF